MPVVLSDSDAEKIKAELERHRMNVSVGAHGVYYREQWLQMLDRLIDKLGQMVPAVGAKTE